MKRFYKIFASWFLCLFLVLSQFIVSFADVNSLTIESGSNALMTLELDDSNYGIMPYSSIASINNTVNLDSVKVYIRLINEESGMYEYQFPSVNQGGGFRYYVPNGYSLDSYGFRLERGALPVPGRYLLQLDFASDVSLEYNAASLVTTRKKNNVTEESSSVTVMQFTEFYSGDIYTEFVGQFGSINSLRLSYRLDEALPARSLIAGYVKVAFTETDASVDVDVVSTVDSEIDYQTGVSDTLSDLSSSVDSMTEDLSSAAENLEYISTSQNLIIQGIDNVVMHISDQLFAFWNQLFNLIHVPTMAKMDDIIDAINNMDLEIEVNLDGLKTTINNMSSAVQNKLQSTTDQITGGYDNTEITQENEKLEQSINQYDEVESGIFEDAEGFIGDFEYPSVDSLPFGIIKALAFVGSFLQGVFLSMGEFSVIITFSLTMIFVMVVVGYHRIRS